MCAAAATAAASTAEPTAHRVVPQRFGPHLALAWRRPIRYTRPVPRRRMVPTTAAATTAAAALLPEAAAAAGGSAALATVERLLHVVDVHVLGATTGAAAKLAMVCALVGWLLRTGQLPSNTAAVMSRVSFTLLIPAMLFTKVATTLAAQPAASVLATISIATLAQVAVGALLAEWIVGPAVDHFMQPRAACVVNSGNDSSRSSSSSSSASGTSGLGASPLAGACASEGGLRRLVTLACSFGSSFTLPVVFFTQMLPPASAERALGFTSLILLSWSPCLWSLGLSIVNNSSRSSSSSKAKAAPHEAGAAAAAAGPAARPVAVAAAAVAAPTSAALSATAAGAGSQFAVAWRAATAFGRQVLTPPFLAILAGMMAGLTPAGRALMGIGSSTAAAGTPPGTLVQASSAVVRSCMDVVKMLAGGTLAAQTVVLAASLLQQPGGDSSVLPEGQQRRGGLLAAAGRLLLPESNEEARALATVAITRFLLLPSLTLGVVWGLGQAGLLPPAVASDPVLLLVLLVQAVMPSAQNLIVLCSLSANTAGLAPMLASLLLKLYALSIAPVSLWVSAWATWLGVAVA